MRGLPRVCRKGSKSVSGARFAALLLLSTFPLPGADIVLRGRIVDENEVRVEGALVVVRIATGAAAQGYWQIRTDPTGAFSVQLPVPGDYVLHALREGYYEIKDRTLHVEASQELTLTMNNVREVFQSVDVNEQPSPVDISQTVNEERLSGTEINDTPYPNSHDLRQSMTLMPGVLRDPTGTLHFNGSSENQVLYLLDGFNITDPISGKFRTRLAVEGIRSLDFQSGRYSPEYGQGSAGVLALSTENGTDAFHYTATDFIPGLQLQKGVRFGSWYPRVGFSGPIVRGRAWFSDTFDSGYTQSLVTGLPSGQNTNSSWAGSNLLHSQFNLTPANIVFADFLVNIFHQNRAGLGPLDPVPTTSNLRNREYFVSVKDQYYVGHGALVEVGYAHNYFSNVQTPQGTGLYVFSPQGRSGSYFVDARQTASRDQVLLNGFLPSFQFAGSHQIKAGVGLDLLHYTGDFHRTGYQLLGLSGNVLSQTIFQSAAKFPLSDTERSAFLADTWRLTKRVQLDLGVRGDWDRQIGDLAWSPHVAASWAPFASGRTRIAGGYSFTHDVPTLEMLGRPLDQTALTTVYNADGSPAGGPALTAFAPISHSLLLPRADNWTLNVDHQLSERLYLTVKYLRRHTRDGFAFVNLLAPAAPPSGLPLPNATLGGNYALTNSRRDEYDAVTLSVRQNFSGQYEWMASYTRSRTVSNAVLDLNTIDPLQVISNLVDTPWNAPNRFLGWAYLPLPWKYWAVGILADARSGFPFSVIQPTGLIVGGPDSHRFPANFDLNVSIERLVTFAGYRFAVRLGVNNLTGQTNSTAVNNVLGAPQYLQFYGTEGRHAVLRIRFFGRAEKKP